jgi:Protein of unknown function (DUF3126)
VEKVVDVQEIRKLDAYLKRLFRNARMRVVPRPKKDDSAEVYIGDDYVGLLTVDDEDGERSYNFEIAIQDGAGDFKAIEGYLKRRLGNDSIRVLLRAKKKDSADVHLGEEFIGVVFADDAGGGNSHTFDMTILDIDLETA